MVYKVRVRFRVGVRGCISAFSAWGYKNYLYRGLQIGVPPCKYQPRPCSRRLAAAVVLSFLSSTFSKHVQIRINLMKCHVRTLEREQMGFFPSILASDVFLFFCDFFLFFSRAKMCTIIDDN